MLRSANLHTYSMHVMQTYLKISLSDCAMKHPTGS